MDVVQSPESIESAPVSRVDQRARTVNIREFLPDDCSQVTALAHRYGLGSSTNDQWMHLWDHNPAYADTSEEWPRGWVVEASNNEIVGYLGNIPLWYEFEGRRLLVAASQAWVVDARFRQYSILLLDRCFKQKNVDLYMCTTANQRSSGILFLFNSGRVPVGAWDESMFWITNYTGFLRSWAAMKSPRLGRRFSRGRTVSLSTRQMGTWDGDCVEYHESFDERFETFWQELRQQQQGVLLAVRSREVLQWHFKHALAKNNIWIMTACKGDRLLAYSVFCRQDNTEYGLQRMRLVDFQALRGNSGLLLAMADSALARCRQQRIDMLECVGIRKEFEQMLAPLCPFRRHLPSWLYYYTAASPALGARLASPEAWNPSCFDGDASL